MLFMHLDNLNVPYLCTNQKKIKSVSRAIQNCKLQDKNECGHIPHLK